MSRVLPQTGQGKRDLVGYKISLQIAKLGVLLYIGKALICPQYCFAQPSSSQVIRAQELIQKEEELRAQIEKDNKFFIREIQINGASKLSKDEIAAVITPYQNKWLTKSSIEQILSLIEQSYSQEGFPQGRIKSDFKINKDTLVINIEEVAIDKGGAR